MGRCSCLIACLLATAAVFVVSACGSRDESRSVAFESREASDGRVLPPVADVTTARVVVLGDSLTAGLGLPPKQAYPTLLQEYIDDNGLKFTIVNAGASGDTSAGALARLNWALDGDVRVLIVALGGNDALRGLPVAELTRNLSTIITRAQVRGIAVVLAGMEAPPNYGFDYTLSFHKVYPELAKKHHVALVPFLLKDVGGIPALNQADGIHPNAAGARIVADNVWAALKPVLDGQSRRVAQGRAAGQ